MSHLNSGCEYDEELGAAAAGCNIVEYLARRYTSAEREEWRERIISGRILLDGIPADPDAVLRPGQKLVWRRPPWEEPDVPLAFAVLYKEAIAKPPKLKNIPESVSERKNRKPRTKQKDSARYGRESILAAFCPEP